MMLAVNMCMLECLNHLFDRWNGAILSIPPILRISFALFWSRLACPHLAHYAHVFYFLSVQQIPHSESLSISMSCNFKHSACAVCLFSLWPRRHIVSVCSQYLENRDFWRHHSFRTNGFLQWKQLVAGFTHYEYNRLYGFRYVAKL